MKHLSKRQQKRIQYFLKEKMERRDKQQIVHGEELPGYMAKRVPYVRRLAKNIDQLLIVVSFVSPPLKPGLIDRFLVLTELEEIEPAICFNKIDLLDDPSEADAIADIYRRIGYPVFITSVKTGQGLAEIAGRLQNLRSALAGHSGVGKSSLLNAIAPDLQITVNDVSTYSNKGKHTTTQIRIYQLNEQTEVIDMPGIKLLDFIDLHKKELRFYYREFLPYAEFCKFRDCLHIAENECGVKKAVDEQKIHPLRYESYLNIVESLS